MTNLKILVTLDSNYITPLKIMLKSLFLNNPHEKFDIYMIYASITNEEIEDVASLCEKHKSKLIPLYVREDMFSDAPVFLHYTKAMYYRLLAFELLPKTLTKILYLDPDILVINKLTDFYTLDINDYLYAAAMHSGITGFTESFNKFRLKTYEAAGYYNSGVLLMNLDLQRKYIKKEDIFKYVKEHEKELLLPDQDILNALYGHQILSVCDSLYNYDARRYHTYFILSEGKYNMDWVMENTVFLHFCGKSKPWKRNYANRFSSLYKHYAALTKR